MSENYSTTEKTYNLETDKAEADTGSSDSDNRKNRFEVLTHSYKQLKEDTKSFTTEIRQECFQLFEVYEVIDYIKNNWSRVVFIPYLPAFHKPGWLLRYVIGPHTGDLLQSVLADIIAGITVALTLIPQALSYATLANLPAINGLYTATLPSAFYTFFGSSMQLAVGPVALVSLLQAELIVNKGITPGSQEAVDFAGECALAVGTILTLMSILNLGDLIRFISHPVMSGFTTAAACLIGQNQLKAAFGFTVSVPQAGQDGYDINYYVMKWFANNWNRNDESTNFQNIRNFFAQRISLGLYFSMMFFVLIKNYIKPTPERKKTWWFNLFNLFVNMMPLIAILIGGHIAWQIKHDDHYNDPNYQHSYFAKKLSIVGKVASGVDFVHAPRCHWNFFELLGDVFPLALILFMESWSVAQRIATQNNQLHLLNASQELWSIGVANLLASCSSAYPVAGSFSRSSLNQAAGGKTPLSKVITMSAVLLALNYLTKTFQYIPNAALAAIIWTAIYNLVSVSDFWHAWKHSKKDFFIMLTTAMVVYFTTTGIGLAVGMAASVLMLLIDLTFNTENGPEIIKFDTDHESDDVIHLKFRADVNFLTAGRFVDTVSNYTVLKDNEDKKPEDFHNWNDRVFYQVSSFLDKWLSPRLNRGVDKYPKAIIIDFGAVFVTDITAMHAIEDMARNCRAKSIGFTIINTTPSVAKQLTKFHIQNDDLLGRTHHALAVKYNTLAGDIIPVRSSGFAATKKELDNEDQEVQMGLLIRSLDNESSV